MGDLSQTEQCEPAETVDARGQWCPVPATWAKLALDGLNPGDVLAVLSSDPLAPLDLAVLCEQLGHRLVDTVEADGGHVTTLQKALKR